ncbi:MAG TPA: hypothetical protein VIJ16_00090 [Gemmatimonadaceae bacterium]
MNDFNDQHTPTSEFRAALERDIARELRRERQFEPAARARARARRGRRIVMIAGLAAGAILMVTVGMVLGMNTKYASAMEASTPRLQRVPGTAAGAAAKPPTAGGASSALGFLRRIPAALSCGAAPIGARGPNAQQEVPVVDLPSAQDSTMGDPLRGVLGVRQVSDGDVLVDDAGRRQLKLYDSHLELRAVVRDSAPGSATSYGPQMKPLIRYMGDSSMLVDGQAYAMLVLGPNGQVVRTLAPTSQTMVYGMNNGPGFVDDSGRILYSWKFSNFMQPTMPGVPDSQAVVRVDLETRRIDTLAKIRTTGTVGMASNGDGIMHFYVEPIAMVDNWALLSDGSIAVVRGSDYHIDWIAADGARHSTPKLPFDWKRLTDEDKQRLIDSTREVAGPRLALALAQRNQRPTSDDGGGGRGGARGYSPPSAPDPSRALPKVEYDAPTFKDLPDYYPALRPHAAMPDLDGNLWILPTSSAQSKHGELVYDVVNVKGDFHRVRVPLGRSIAGFGKGGVVYLLSGDTENGFHLEKTQLPPLRAPPAK